MLRPDVPTVAERLLRDERKVVWYEAELRDPSPKGYAEHYREVLRSRGTIFKPIGSSPHAIPPRLWGYETLFLRRGKTPVFSISYASFNSRDDDWLKEHGLWNAPDPLRVEDRHLTLLLGKLRRPWTERVIVPERDVVDVREFPFARYPGAVLQALSPANVKELGGDAAVSRHYVVRNGDMSRVVEHYKRELGRLGIEARIDNPERTSLYWQARGLREKGAEEPKAQLTQVHIGNAGPDVVPGSGFNIGDLREAVPSVLKDEPSAIYFSIHVGLAGLTLAESYVMPLQEPRR